MVLFVGMRVFATLAVICACRNDTGILVKLERPAGISAPLRVANLVGHGEPITIPGIIHAEDRGQNGSSRVIEPSAANMDLADSAAWDLWAGDDQHWSMLINDGIPGEDVFALMEAKDEAEQTWQYAIGPIAYPSAGLLLATAAPLSAGSASIRDCAFGPVADPSAQGYPMFQLSTFEDISYINDAGNPATYRGIDCDNDGWDFPADCHDYDSARQPAWSEPSCCDDTSAMRRLFAPAVTSTVWLVEMPVKRWFWTPRLTCAGTTFDTPSDLDLVTQLFDGGTFMPVADCFTDGFDSRPSAAEEDVARETWQPVNGLACLRHATTRTAQGRNVPRLAIVLSYQTDPFELLAATTTLGSLIEAWASVRADYGPTPWSAQPIVHFAQPNLHVSFTFSDPDMFSSSNPNEVVRVRLLQTMEGLSPRWADVVNGSTTPKLVQRNLIVIDHQVIPLDIYMRAGQAPSIQASLGSPPSI